MALRRPGTGDAASATEGRAEACVQLIRDLGHTAEGLAAARCAQRHFKPVA